MYIETNWGGGRWRRKYPMLGARATSQRDKFAKMKINQSIDNTLGVEDYKGPLHFYVPYSSQACTGMNVTGWRASKK